MTDLLITQRRLSTFGTVYVPAGEGPFPAVMLLHGSEGGWSGWGPRNALLFAAHGFLAFPFPWSLTGSVWMAGEIRDVPLERTAEAMEAFRAVPETGGKVGLWGVSRGGEQALLLASLLAEAGAPLPDALAAHAPSDIVNGAFDPAGWLPEGDVRVRAPVEGAAWTWQGTSARIGPGTEIAVERYPGPVFMSVGDADSIWDPGKTLRLKARLEDAGRTPEVLVMPGEDHAFTPEGENLLFSRLMGFFRAALG